MYRRLITLIFLAGVITGCSLADLSTTARANRFMESGDYRQAEIEFRDVVRERPDNALSQYYLGRFLLAQDKAAEALPHFQRAAVLEPDNADYSFCWA